MIMDPNTFNRWRRQYFADGASLEAAISAVRPDVSVLDLLGL